MKKEILTVLTSLLLISLTACTTQSLHFQKDNLELINREIVTINDSRSALTLNRTKADGMAIVKDLDFDEGVIELELKGENNPGKSFVGIAFNIQNDSTYEAVYFRPFNFRSDEKARRDHSIQYIYHPKYSWRFLRTNYEGQFESAYPHQPLPDEWFTVRIKIDDKNVYVYDQKTNKELLAVERLTKQVSNRVGLWTGFNSKGEFRNLKVMNKY